MRNNKKKRIAAIGLSLVFALSFCFGCGDGKSSNKDADETETAQQMEEAMHTSFGRYPETITYTLGKLTGSNNSNLPEGDTYEDNAYTRLLAEKLNIQNDDVFELSDEKYNENVKIAIASRKIPDVMVVSNVEDLEQLVKNDLIADLSTSYDECLTDTIKEIYGSYGSALMDMVTFNGKIMALPETNIAEGPNLLWLRKDWMEALGLEDPKTLEDVEYIVSQFIEKNPGKNAEQTIGILCDPDIVGGCGYSSEYKLDVVFATFNSFPKQWIKNEDGEIVYGSVTKEAKDALAHIHEMYEEGIIDHNFIFRTSSNIIDLIKNGQSGSFFGPWWAPNNPLMDAVAVNSDANWVPYLIETDGSGVTRYHSTNPTYKYVVVRKDYEHPEIAAKMISVLFDYARYQKGNDKEFEKYYQYNVDPTARPLAINVDYKNALNVCYIEIMSAITGEKNAENLNLLEYSYCQSCMKYMEDPKSADPETWAAYTSRISACRLINDGKLEEVRSYFYGTTPTMQDKWWELEQKAQQVYLQIITGEKSIDEFDAFVSEWYAQGGEQITKEVREKINE